MKSPSVRERRTEETVPRASPCTRGPESWEDVPHPRGSPSPGAPPGRRIREVAAEHTVRLLHSAHPDHKGRVEEPLVLPLAWMHVERDTPARAPVDRDVEALDGGMPALVVHDRCESHAEEPGVEVEDR